jgi:cyclopropane fatty-acyl-phospholipid synthase-like methyltransferase
MEDKRELWFKPVRAGWDPHFFERYFETPLGAAIRAREEEAVYDFLGSVMEPDHSILEIGPGTGTYTVPMARRCAEVVAIDSSPEMLCYLRKRVFREGLENVEVRPGQLPGRLEALGEFDGALAIGILNYAEDLEKSLRALTSALKPGGWAVFNAPVPTIEGRIYALTELVNRRRVYLLSADEIVNTAKRAGLRVENAASAGLSQGGLTLVIGAVVSIVPSSACS